MLSVRPKVAELVFQLYGRPLHPELFECHQTRTIKRGPYEAKIDITSAGHLVNWRYDGLNLTEVCTAAHHPLPQKRRLLPHLLSGQRQDQMECRGGIIYSVDFQMESVDPAVFWTCQQELAGRGIDEGLFHAFDASGRMALGALSFISVESRNRTLRVRAFHTFPDDYAIVKTESRFELP